MAMADILRVRLTIRPKDAQKLVGEPNPEFEVE